MNTASPAVPELTMVQEKDIQQSDHVLPRMPPWFNGIGSQKLYEALGGVLRLVGLSLAGFKLFLSDYLALLFLYFVPSHILSCYQIAKVKVVYRLPLISHWEAYKNWFLRFGRKNTVKKAGNIGTGEMVQDC